jgi:hypothetical protein
VLAQVIAFIEADPAFTLVRRIGPANAPHTLVVSMTESQAAMLAQQFPDELIVERDRPLTLYRESQALSAAHEIPTDPASDS